VKKPERILIVGPNWMGDMIFMTPAIRAIRRCYPDSTICCLVPPRGLDLLSGNPHLNAVIPLNEKRGPAGIFQWWPLIRKLRAEKFDMAFLFHRSFTRTLVVWAAGVRNRIGYRTWKRGWLLTQAVDPVRKDSVHKADWFLRMLEGAGLATDGMKYEVGLSAEDHQEAQQLLNEWNVGKADRIVALHPGANWRLKRWPVGDFARLGDALADRYRAKVLFVGDKGDLPLVQQIQRKMRTRPLVATGRTSFRQLGALLAKSSLLVSNDSGPLHLGLAVGTPVIALFGPTDPALTGPPEGSNAVTLFGSIGCPVPCYQLQCPVNLCMSQISVEKVLEAAGPFLS